MYRYIVIKYSSNLLIIIGLGGLIFTFSPLLGAYLPRPAKTDVSPVGTYLTIAKIGAYAPIVFGVDSQSQSAYTKALEKGVAHAAGTSLPGESGTMFIFAHSSDLPWRISRYNTIFLRLGELENGDEIKVTDNGREYNYAVFDKKIVWPDEVQYLHQLQNQLILQTCWPLGTTLKRLLVFARPTSL